MTCVGVLELQVFFHATPSIDYAMVVIELNEAVEREVKNSREGIQP